MKELYTHNRHLIKIWENVCDHDLVVIALYSEFVGRDQEAVIKD